MNSLTLELYFLSVFMNLRDAFIGLMIFAFVLMAINIFRWGILHDSDESTEKAQKATKIYGTLGCVIIILVAFFPTNNQVTVMIASEVLTRSQIGDNLTGIGADAADLLHKWILREKLRMDKEMKSN